MNLAKYVACQLHHPAGPIGRIILPRLFNLRNRALNDLTLKFLELNPNDRVLELGFGGGYLLGRISEIITSGWIAGIDSSPEMVAFCKKKYRSLVSQGKLEIQHASAEALPYPEDQFTKACTVNTIFYFPNTTQAIQELWRVLAYGGALVVCFTSEKCLENRKFTRNGLKIFRETEVQDIMESCGFQHIRMIHGSDKWREFACAVGIKLSKSQRTSQAG